MISQIAYWNQGAATRRDWAQRGKTDVHSSKNNYNFPDTNIFPYIIALFLNISEGKIMKQYAIFYLRA